MNNNWTRSTIGDLLALQRGYDLTDEQREIGSIPVMGAAGRNGFHSEARATAPGIVVGRSGGSFGQVHFACEDFWPHNTAMFVTDFKGNDPHFVYYFLKKLNFSKLNSGSAQPSLNRNYVYHVRICVPPPGEQKKIGAVLATLDAKVELNNRINAELEALAKTIYDYWFVQFDFPDANRRPYKTSGGKMVYNATLKREIPAGWRAGSLDDLGEIVGGSTPPTSNPEHFGHDMIPWITPKDLSNNKGRRFISRGGIDISEVGRREASLKLHPTGTVLMSSRAPVGYLAIALNPVTTNQGFKSFVPSKGYGTSFIYYTVARSLPRIIQYASGSTFSEISGGVLKAMHTVLPTQEIVEAFSNVLEPITERQKSAELESEQLTQLRDWLLPLLMNGQVHVD